MPAQNDSQAELEALTSAIDAFETKKATILQKAFEEGGASLVEQLVDEVEALKDVRFELLRAELDRRNPAFADLAKQARTASEALERSIKRLQTIARVLEGISSVVNLLSRLIVRFAI